MGENWPQTTSEEYAELVSGKGIKAQFAIDTGMNRIGLDADDCNECERIIRKYYSAFQLTGLFTHLCVADMQNEKIFTEQQVEKIKAVVDFVLLLNTPKPLIHQLQTRILILQKRN